MNNSKIDQRIREIEDEVVLLTDYMSEALEKKLGVHLSDIKESLDKLQKSGSDISKGELILPDLAEDLSGLKSSIDKIIKIIGTKEFKTQDDSLNLSLENNFGSLMEKLDSLDVYINESIKKSAENKEELLKTFLENIDKQKTLSETIQHFCAVDEEKTLGEEIGLINKHIEEISGEVLNLSETGRKGLTFVDEVLQNTEGYFLKQEELKKTLIENFDKLKTLSETIQRLCTVDDRKTLGEEIGLINKNIEEISGEILKLADTSSKGLASFGDVLQNTEGYFLKQEELNKTLLENFDKLKTLSETIQRLCTVDEKKTLGEEIGIIGKHIEEISGEILNLAETNHSGLTSVEEVLKSSEEINFLKQEELKKSLLENFDRQLLSIDKILQLCKMDEGKQLGAEIALLSDKIENVAIELPNLSKIINNEVAQLNSGVRNSVEQFTKQQIEIRDALLKGIKNINDNSEVIRRMCSTDQEKFLGSMTTVVYNNMNEILETMNSLQEKVKNWLFAIDNNLKTLAYKSELKQEETKKNILNDLKKLNDAVEILKIWCTTENNRPLGSEMIYVSNKIKKMYEETPLILEKVTLLASQLDNVSYEVKRMRLFIIGAVAVSIIVLVVSFFK
jgi:hypothetical protein